MSVPLKLMNVRGAMIPTSTRCDAMKVKPPVKQSLSRTDPSTKPSPQPMVSGA
jgi:hypothetical protein